MTKYRNVEEYLRDWPAGVSGGKGSDTAKAQMEKQNALQQQAFDMQKAQLGQLNSAFGQYINGNVGYDPALKAALQSQFQNQTADQYGQASSAVKDAILAHGGSGQMPMSGQDISGLVGLEGAKANTLSQGMLGLGINDLQQGLTNKFNAGSILSGNAATLNSPISTFGAGASNALDQYIKAANSGFGAAFMQSFGGTLGKGVGGMVTGGLGTLGGPGFGGCWIARAVYGDDNPKWLIFRAKFFSKDGFWQRAYMRFGERVSWLVKRSPLLKACFRNLCDRVIEA